MIWTTSFLICAYYNFLSYHTRMTFRFSGQCLFELKTEPVSKGDTERVRQVVYRGRWYGNISRQDRSGDVADDHKRMVHGAKNREQGAAKRN